MGLPEGVNRRYAFIAAVILAILWVWVAFDRPYTFPKHVPWNTDANTPQSTPQSSTALNIVHDVFEYPTVESESIRNMCKATQWNQTLVFICDNADGNVAQVRNSILMCVRYAITAGANMVLPRIINGDGNHKVGWTILDWDRQDFDFMFDKQHFLDSMHHSCPEMSVYHSRDDVPFPDNYVRPPIITIRAEKLVLREGEDWRTAFYKLVRDMVSPTEDTKPIVIEMARPSPDYDVYTDGRQFASDFGQLLKFRSDARTLANKTLQKLAQMYNLTFNDQPIARNTFFGVHLYTEKDRLGPKEGWPAIDWEYARYDPESKQYLDQASKKAHRLIYVASNRPDQISKFTKDAKALNMRVHTKYDLLRGADAEELIHLTKDQQELVDYLVLLKASDFAGIGHSSISWNVALKRHLFAPDGQFTIGSHIFEDELSHVYGKMIDGRTLYHSMWP